MFFRASSLRWYASLLFEMVSSCEQKAHLHRHAPSGMCCLQESGHHLGEVVFVKLRDLVLPFHFRHRMPRCLRIER
eukprot:759802-Hanusia_phi.AAC.2